MKRISEAARAEIERLRRLLLIERSEIDDRERALLEGKSGKVLERDGVLARRLSKLEESPALLGGVRWVLGEDPTRPGHLAGFSARPGAIVALRGGETEGRDPTRGVVVRAERSRMVVVFDEPPDVDPDSPIDLLLGADEVTIGRLLDGLAAAERSERRSAELIEMLLGVRPPRPIPEGRIEPLDPELNADQLEAIRKAVLAEDLALIHGPFGTGKTTTLVEVVRQAAVRGERVLCLAASNAAVDHLALSILAKDPRLALVRVGHPARAHPELEAHTLAARIEASPRRELARDLAQRAFALYRRAGKWSRAADGAAKRREMRDEARALLRDSRQLERQAAQDVLGSARIIAGTLTGFAQEIPSDLQADSVVIDEASQALTPAVILGAMRARRVVLAGDHRQLPPTIVSSEAARGGLGRTVFESLIDRHPAVGHLLTVQHRMHADLMRFSSERFYDGRLTAHPLVAGRVLADLGVATNDLIRADRPLDVIDTAGAGLEERVEPGGSSRENPGQAEIVRRIVGALISSGLTPAAIGVIVPYAAQVALLHERLSEWTLLGVEIDTVDGFQGREKDAIVFDAVRSNAGGELGFLSDDRRLNVALTRARRKLVIIADSATLSRHSIWAALFDAAAELGAHRSVFELPEVAS